MTTAEVLEIAADCIAEVIYIRNDQMGKRVDTDAQEERRAALERIRKMIQQEAGTTDYTGQRELERPWKGD